jgi:hypothetical protein
MEAALSILQENRTFGNTPELAQVDDLCGSRCIVRTGVV